MTEPAVIQPGQLDFTARYRISGWGGVAWRAVRYSTSNEYEGDQLICEDEECDHQLSEMCWAEGDWSTVTDHDWVVVIMVGDDREFTHEVTDLELLTDDEYCSGCGQIGCGHGG